MGWRNKVFLKLNEKERKILKIFDGVFGKNANKHFL
jgi:hypothetical protein